MTTALRPAPESKARTSEFRPFEVKDVDDGKRTFTGMAAAFSLDQGGDVILPGAFRRTLSDFKRAKSRIIPLIDVHNRGSVRAVVGKMLAGQEVKDGLEGTFELIDGPDGDEVFRRIKGGYVDGLSIGYEPIEIKLPNTEESRAGIWRFLKEIRLVEVSVVPFPMNMDARIDLQSVKSLLEQEDLSAEDRAELVSLNEQISALLAKSAPGSDPAQAPGLAIDDPKRLALEATVRAITLRSLDTGI